MMTRRRCGTRRRPGRTPQCGELHNSWLAAPRPPRAQPVPLFPEPMLCGEEMRFGVVMRCGAETHCGVVMRCGVGARARGRTRRHRLKRSTGNELARPSRVANFFLKPQRAAIKKHDPT